MKKTLLALAATTLMSGGAIAADIAQSSDSFSVTWTGQIPVVEKTPTGWTLKDGDDTLVSLTKALTVTESTTTAGDLVLSSPTFTITAAADTSSDASATLGALEVYLSDASIEGLTPEPGADPVSLDFTVGNQTMTELEKGNSYTKVITASGAGAVESLNIGFKGDVKDSQWDSNVDTNIAVTASFVITAGI